MRRRTSEHVKVEVSERGARFGADSALTLYAHDALRSTNVPVNEC